jgi:CubicO group peptidase (beta-lactamase class C family)
MNKLKRWWTQMQNNKMDIHNVSTIFTLTRINQNQKGLKFFTKSFARIGQKLTHKGLITLFLLLLHVYASDTEAAAKKSEVTVPITTTIKDTLFDDVRENMINMVRNDEAPSLSVAVAQDGRIIWEESFGWADREKDIPATPHTMYSIASTSKPITATGLMILVEQGLVRLDEPVNSYIAPVQLTAYEGNAIDATVKHLLNHTAGLPLHYSYFYQDEPHHKVDMAESIRRYGIMVHPPGETYEYSNFGYGILDYIIEKESGRTFPDFMKNEVFQPLGMTHSSVNIGSGLEEYAATRYEQDKSPIPFYDVDHAGASAVYSSAQDLMRFGMFHLKDPLPDQTSILNAEAIDEMQREKDKEAVNWTEETKSGYTLGWMINENSNGYTTVSHGGGMPGVVSSFTLIPSEKIVIAVLSNSLNFRVFGFFDEIASAMLPQYKQNLEKNRERNQPEHEAESVNPLSELLGIWEGTVKTYDGEMSIRMEFHDDGDVHVLMNQAEGSNDILILESLLNNVNFKDNTLTGQFYGTVVTNDAKRHPHNVLLNMKLKGNYLVGYASAYSTTKRVHFALSSYISLTKK